MPGEPGERSAAVFNQKNTSYRRQLQRYCGHGNSIFFGIEAVCLRSRPGMRIPEPWIFDFPAERDGAGNCLLR